MVKVLFFTIGACLFFTSCKKYLDATPSKQLLLINGLEDLQPILDNYSKINYNEPGSSEVAADNYYMSFDYWQGLAIYDRNAYVWSNTNVYVAFNSASSNDWSQSYDVVYLANTVLDNIKRFPRIPSNATSLDDIKGQALFLRGRAFMQVAFIWAVAYDSSTAKNDVGIPLKLSSDFNDKTVRASNADTYTQIIQDLKGAASILPTKPLHVLRASKAAAYGLLSRVYLSMRQYDNALLYADSALQIQSQLMDFNTLDSTQIRPVPLFNSEVIFESGVPIPSPIFIFGGNVDSTLVRSFAVNDLRNVIFLNSNGDGTFGFKGSYDLATGYYFNGIAVDEMYLNRAECKSRLGNVNGAINDLNTLLATRWRTGTYIPFSTTDKADALALILQERRKELMFRFLRWADMKRLNKEGAGISATRVLDGNTYRLPANSLRFANPIPEDVIQLSGISQNRY